MSPRALPTARCVRQIPTLHELDLAVSTCRACPRLVAWRERVAVEKRAAFADQEYWAKPVPGFGPADALIGIVGLAPAAHGGNRTGRVFTGDRSGDWLFAALHRAGLADQPHSTGADDGLRLRHTRIVAAVRCAPPQNKPTPVERDTCAPWLDRELELLLPTLRVIVVLGAFGWASLWPALGRLGVRVPRPRPVFGHGVCVELSPTVDELDKTAVSSAEIRSNVEFVDKVLDRPLTVLGCYHVSQQNTFTGKLTAAMLDDVFERATMLASALN